MCVFRSCHSLCKGLHELLMGKMAEGFWDGRHVGQAAEGARRLWRGYVLA